MEKLSLLKISVLLLLFVTLAFAGNAGGQGNAMMRAPLGATAWGRGGAYSAAPENSHALWNPAVSANLKEARFSFGSEFRPLGRFGTYFSGEVPVKRRKIGFSYLFVYRGIPSLDSLRDSNGDLLEDASYGSILLKSGLSIKLSQKFLLGLSLGWNMDKLPIDFDDQTKKIEYGRSKEFAGITLMGSLKPKEKLTFAFGFRDMLFKQDWTLNSQTFATIIKDTLPLDLVFGTSYELDIARQAFQIDGDLDAYVLNSFFKPLNSPYAHLRLGMSWMPNSFVTFRLGVRDLLLAGSLRDMETYKLEATPRYSAGFGFATKKLVKFARTRINYAVSNSGANAGLDHGFDFVLLF